MTPRRAAYILALLLAPLLAACSAPSPSDPPEVERQEIALLSQQISALGPEVDAEEAARAAHIAITYSRQLAREYHVTDPPLIHNMKVNSGLRPRGLCYQWADDIEARLRQEQFRTLVLHRAIANADNPFLIDHSTTIISRRGDDMFGGIILDPWRRGGDLFWSRTLADKRYDWVPRSEVFASKRRLE